MLSYCESTTSQYYVMYGAGAVVFFRLRQKSAKEPAPAPQRCPPSYQTNARYTGEVAASFCRLLSSINYSYLYYQYFCCNFLAKIKKKAPVQLVSFTRKISGLIFTRTNISEDYRGTGWGRGSPFIDSAAINRQKTQVL